MDVGELKIEVPEGWRNVSDENAISFSSPSERAALTVTVHDRAVVDEAVVDRINATSMPFGEALSGKLERSVPSGTGYSRTFIKKNAENERHWIAHFLFLSDVTVIGSVNSGSEEMVGQRTCFESILTSIEFRKTMLHRPPPLTSRTRR
jgi:hypothetical protein